MGGGKGILVSSRDCGRPMSTDVMARIWAYFHDTLTETGRQIPICVGILLISLVIVKTRASLISRARDPGDEHAWRCRVEVLHFFVVSALIPDQAVLQAAKIAGVHL